jgi:hypothetical protein
MRAQKSSIVCWAPKRARSALGFARDSKSHRAQEFSPNIYGSRVSAKHCKRLPGFTNWLSIETEQLNRHRYPEIQQLAQRRTEMVLEAPLGVPR